MLGSACAFCRGKRALGVDFVLEALAELFARLSSRCGTVRLRRPASMGSQLSSETPLFGRQAKGGCGHGRSSSLLGLVATEVFSLTRDGRSI